MAKAKRKPTMSKSPGKKTKTHVPATAFAAMPKIGFLHSTSFETTLEEAFLAGLRSAGWEGDAKKPVGSLKRVRVKKRLHSGNYGVAADNKVLAALAQEVHGKNNNIKLVITTGGLIAAQAVWSISDTTPPQIFAIIGAADSAMPSNVIAWNMDSSSQNATRIVKLLSKYTSLAAGDVWLLFNSNSVIGTTEGDNFAGGGVLNALTFSSTGHNDDIDFGAAFDQLATLTAKAVIVSSDPFFFNQRGLLTAEGIRTGLKMCFPNSEYFTFAGSDTTKYISYGPTLVSVYTDLGAKAGAYLNDTSTTITPDTDALKNLDNGA